MHLPIIIEQDEEGYYIVSCPIYKGCHSYGETIDEAMEHLKEVIELCMNEEKVSIPYTKFIGMRDLFYPTSSLHAVY
jgi:predicted RNase H-like HicB family nuclease